MSGNNLVANLLEMVCDILDKQQICYTHTEKMFYLSMFFIINYFILYIRCVVLARA